MKQELIEIYTEKFAGRTVDDFLLKIDTEIDELIYAVECNSLTPAEEQIIEQQIIDLQKEPLYKGICSYEFASNFTKAFEKKNKDFKIREIYTIIPFDAAHFQQVKDYLDEDYYCCVDDDEDSKIMFNEFQEIKNITGLKKWLKKYDLLGSDYQIFNKQFVSCLTDYLYDYI